MFDNLRHVRPILIIIVVLCTIFVILFMIVGRHFVVPNSRSYRNGNIRAGGSLSLFKTARYEYVEVGSALFPYIGSPPLWVRQDYGGVVRPDMIDASVVLNTSSSVILIDPDQDWPLGCKEAQMGLMKFWIVDEQIISFAVHWEDGRQVEMSRDGVEWFSFPLGQPEVQLLFGDSGTVRDFSRFRDNNCC